MRKVVFSFHPEFTNHGLLTVLTVSGLFRPSSSLKKGKRSEENARACSSSCLSVASRWLTSLSW